VNLHYDLARALMLYLQEKTRSSRCTRRSSGRRPPNPYALPIATCRAALEKALGGPMDKINSDFRAWLSSTKD
jgi:hypothetical protein